MPHRLNTLHLYLRRYGVWGLVLSLQGAIFSIFLGVPELNFGIWNQSEPVLIGLHFCAALAAISLSAVAYSTKKLRTLTWHPIVLIPLSVALWSFLVGFTHDFPSLNWFGSPELGEGVLWYLELSVFAAAAGIVRNFRLARRYLAGSAIAITCVVTALTINFLQTGQLQFVPFFFSDYLAFSGIYVAAIAVTFLRGTNRLNIVIGVLAGLLIVYFSDNRAAMVLVFVLAPIVYGGGYLLSKYASTWPLRGAGVLVIASFVLATTTILSTVDFRPIRDNFTSNITINSGLNSLVSRQHLLTLSLEAIENRRSVIAMGQGWGMFSDHFASYLPVDWVTLRDDSSSWTKSERALSEGHWDAINRVDFHNHNVYLEALLSIGIIGALLVLGITATLPLWCRKDRVVVAGTVGFASAGLFALWFQLPSNLPLLALALGGFVAPVNFRWNFTWVTWVKKAMPWIWVGVAVLLLASGLIAARFVPYAYFYSPSMKLPLLSPTGELKCADTFEDQRRGGGHLVHRLGTFSNHIKRRILKAEEIQIDQVNYLRGLICASETYIDSGSSIRLLIAALHIRSDFAFLDVPYELKSLLRFLLKSWPARIDALLTQAPKRTDLAAPYLLYLLKSGKESKFSEFAAALFSRNPNDPIALWFSGIALLSQPEMGRAGMRRMRDALQKGLERLIPIDQALKRQLLPNETVSTPRKSRLVIKTIKGAVTVEAELADTASTRERGLMGRTSLSEKSGMVLHYPKAQFIELWMKDTYLSLDLIFIDSLGYVRKIIRRTQPLSLSIIKSDIPIKAVLEVNAGFVDKFGIQLNNRVLSKSLFVDSQS